MRPLNAKERTLGFWKFVLLFTFTVALIMGAVYFNFAAVPQKELSYYKDQYASMSKAAEAEQKLAAKLNELNANLLKYQNNPKDDLAKTAILNAINELSTHAKSDSLSSFGKLEMEISNSLTVAASTISKLEQSGNASTDMEGLKAELDECKQEVKDKQQEITNLTMQLAVYKN
ncbi:MAG: type VI secretion system TssO [Chitinophagales bacterium]|nr:type VI secretion system TssO [Chitinophagales bacterium]